MLCFRTHVPPEAKPQRTWSAYVEVETTLASLSCYDTLQLRHEDASINAAMLPYMDKASGDGAIKSTGWTQTLQVEPAV
jgi:hypothetical protein